SCAGAHRYPPQSVRCLVYSRARAAHRLQGVAARVAGRFATGIASSGPGPAPRPVRPSRRANPPPSLLVACPDLALSGDLAGRAGTPNAFAHQVQERRRATCHGLASPTLAVSRAAIPKFGWAPARDSNP